MNIKIPSFNSTNQDELKKLMYVLSQEKNLILKKKL